MRNIIKRYGLVLGGIGIMFLQACTTVPVTDPIDPWEGMNRDIFEFNDQVDKDLFKPLAQGYQWITPEFIDEGVTNFFSNLRDIGVSINDFLQAKPKQGSMDVARFLVNSTVGVAGFFDVATLIKLPKHDEDFGQTLGVWGVPMGPYFVLPFYGPSSVRGVGGRAGDMAFHPLTYTTFFANPAVGWGAVGARALEMIDERADFLGAEAVASEAAVDRYLFFRSAYVQRRNYLINDGTPQSLDLEGVDGESIYQGLE